MSTPTLTERIDSLEERVANLKQQVVKLETQQASNTPQESSPWWEQWFGAFKDNPDFDAAMERGAEYRRSLPTAADESEHHVPA